MKNGAGLNHGHADPRCLGVYDSGPYEEYPIGYRFPSVEIGDRMRRLNYFQPYSPGEFTETEGSVENT